MDNDIAAFVRNYCQWIDSTDGVERRGGVSADMIRDISKRYRDRFGLVLPTTYVEICRIEDGIGHEGAELLGLLTRREAGSEFPWTEGLLDAYETQVVDLGESQFITFGVGPDGNERFGLDLIDNQYVSIVRHRTNRLAAYESFDEMFRALFRSGERT